jgi:hypothetical protein
MGRRGPQPRAARLGELLPLRKLRGQVQPHRRLRQRTPRDPRQRQARTSRPKLERPLQPRVGNPARHLSPLRNGETHACVCQPARGSVDHVAVSVHLGQLAGGRATAERPVTCAFRVSGVGGSPPLPRGMTGARDPYPDRPRRTRAQPPHARRHCAEPRTRTRIWREAGCDRRFGQKPRSRFDATLDPRRRRRSVPSGRGKLPRPD